MDRQSESTDRKATDYIVFALAFIGFVIAAGGIILSSSFLASAGAVLLLLALLSFGRQPSPGE